MICVRFLKIDRRDEQKYTKWEIDLFQTQIKYFLEEFIDVENESQVVFNKMAIQHSIENNKI